MNRLRRALSIIMEKHSILRTSLKYDREERCLKQQIQPLVEESPNYSFQFSKISTKDELEKILLDEETNCDLFCLSKGLVFRCHLIHFYFTSDRINNDNADNGDLLKKGDLILLNFHHVAFDGSSAEFFLSELHKAYVNERLERATLQYIDYAQYEREMPMDKAREYWKQSLDGYEDPLQLPYDHTLSLSTVRSGSGGSIRFELDKDIVESILNISTTTSATLFQLLLTNYYLFLFKLTKRTDLCVGSVNANRFRSELQSLVGTTTFI
ncbi:unnamed protein product [Didymodactylos carnosus]|uniref:Condensation domain-containing protein n=1 Tax=Didymodactylos carnosus TaxID=1234261 RepID=A0A815TCH5_9BILA|nr:unnamed protein product [Didymodactylos carnosus]CAF4362845.1 unnamed protein product [Didymodactylos carnosus]